MLCRLTLSRIAIVLALAILATTPSVGSPPAYVPLQSATPMQINRLQVGLPNDTSNATTEAEFLNLVSNVKATGSLVAAISIGQSVFVNLFERQKIDEKVAPVYLISLAWFYVDLGRIGDAVVLATIAHDLATKTSSHAQVYAAYFVLAVCAAEIGETEWSRRLIEGARYAAVDLFADSGKEIKESDRNALHTIESYLSAKASYADGRYAECLERLANFASIQNLLPSSLFAAALSLRGRCAISSNQPLDGRDALLAALQVFEKHEPSSIYIPRLLYSLASIETALGNAAVAAQHLTRSLGLLIEKRDFERRLSKRHLIIPNRETVDQDFDSVASALLGSFAISGEELSPAGLKVVGKILFSLTPGAAARAMDSSVELRNVQTSSISDFLHGRFIHAEQGLWVLTSEDWAELSSGSLAWGNALPRVVASMRKLETPRLLGEGGSEPSEELGSAGLQNLVKEGEALLVFLPVPQFGKARGSYVLSLVTRDAIRILSIDRSHGDITSDVATLRCGLDATAWQSDGTLRCADLLKLSPGQVPKDGQSLPFDAARAHALYRSLLGEAADLIRGKHLLIVPSGALTTLPFQVLVTEPPKAGDLKSVRWLAHHHAITVLPSVAALKALRRTGKPSAAPNPIIGFGNPLLDGDQAHPQHGAYFKKQAQIARAQTGCAKSSQKRTASLRAVARSLAPLPVSGRTADLKHLRIQTPLPETADELCEVARSVGGSVANVRIGARATEAEVKRLSSSGELAKYRILHFATHGTLAGQLKGTSEPGLILTPPEAATDEDDGYLSGREIASLKLDADWVILSACNTAGGAVQGEAAEALSGLARVFFFAGARALLVSHWEVDSAATVTLITTAMAQLAKDKAIGRAEAMRRAMLAVMADTSRPANWVPAWHPSVWAPFVVVGEGGVGR